MSLAKSDTIRAIFVACRVTGRNAVEAGINDDFRFIAWWIRRGRSRRRCRRTSRRRSIGRSTI